MELKISILLLFVLFTISWIYYKQYLTLKYRYKFYELRDNFRNSVISGRIDKRDWTFDYLDNCMSKIINNLTVANLWSIILISLHHKNDKSLEAFKKHLNIGIVNNKEFQNFYNDFQRLIARYLIQKHILTFMVFVICSTPIFSSLMLMKNIKIKVKDFIEYLR